MEKIVKNGDFCPNEACRDYGKSQHRQKAQNIKKYGKSNAGKQRYMCKTCGQSFTETKGTLGYRRRNSTDEIFEALAKVAKGEPLRDVAKATGHKEDTILDWIEAAKNHVQETDEVLIKKYDLEQIHLRWLWSHVYFGGNNRSRQYE